MHDTRTSSSLMASYRFARFFCVYFRYAANVNIPEGSRERSTSRSGVKALSLAIVVSNKKGNQHLENHLSYEITWCHMVSLSKASFTSPYGVTNLQSVDKLGHWDCLRGVPRCAEFGTYTQQEDHAGRPKCAILPCFTSSCIPIDLVNTSCGEIFKNHPLR